jgi:hypothetical protein
LKCSGIVAACQPTARYVADVLDRNERDLDADEKRALRESLVEGMELSTKVGRMCAMNLYLHGIGSESAVVIHPAHDSLAAPWEARVFDGADQSTVWEKAEPALCQRGRRHREGGPDRRPRGLLDLDEQQAAQFRPAHLFAAEDRRPRGGGGAGQCLV